MPRGIKGGMSALRLRQCSRRRIIPHAANLEPPCNNYSTLRSQVARAGYGDQHGGFLHVTSGHDKANDTLDEHVSSLRQLRTKHRHTRLFYDPYNTYRYKGLEEREITPYMPLMDTNRDGTDSKDSKHTLLQQTERFHTALRTKSPYSLFHSLVELPQSQQFSLLAQLPPSVFSEVLRILNPRYFIEGYMKIHQEASPTSVKLLGLSPLIVESRLYTFYQVFCEHSSAILRTRKLDRSATLADYKHLMKCANAIGNTFAFQRSWNDMSAFMTPDLECYNLFLTSLCWSDTLNPNFRHRLRVIPANLQPRSWRHPPDQLKGHRVGDGGIKAQVSRIFQEMIEGGIQGNEQTFCLMITALARENDMEGVKSILKRIWEIDVDSLLHADESHITPPKAYNFSSPFYPSQQLLFTLAHAYGTNNSIPAALQIIDYISRHYEIPIGMDVWQELLQWTSVLSTRRYGKRRQEGNEPGELPQQAVSNLWKTMTSAPYNVKPDMQMYNRLIANLLQRQRYGEVQIRMEEARKVHKRDFLTLSRLLSAFHASTHRTSQQLLDQRAQEISSAHLRLKMNRQYIRRWVRLLIAQGSKSFPYQTEPSFSRDRVFAWHDIPRIVDTWSLFLPNRVKYTTEGGTITFWSGAKERNLDLQRQLTARNLEVIERSLSFSHG